MKQIKLFWDFSFLLIVLLYCTFNEAGVRTMHNSIQKIASEIQLHLMKADEIIFSGDSCILRIPQYVADSIKGLTYNNYDNLSDISSKFQKILLFVADCHDSANSIKSQAIYFKMLFTIDSNTVIQQIRTIIYNKDIFKKANNYYGLFPTLKDALKLIIEPSKNVIAANDRNHNNTFNNSMTSFSNSQHLSNKITNKKTHRNSDSENSTFFSDYSSSSGNISYHDETNENDDTILDEISDKKNLESLNPIYLSSEWNDIEVPEERKFSKGNTFGWGEPPSGEELIHETPSPSAEGNYFGPGPDSRDYEE